MLHPVAPKDRGLLAPFVEALEPHLAPRAVAEGTVLRGEAYIDDPSHPHWALISAGHRVYVAGDSQAAAPSLLEAYFDARWRTRRADAAQVVIVAWEPADWVPVLRLAMRKREPLAGAREHYAIDLAQVTVYTVPMPQGYEVRLVDAALLASGLRGLDGLREEMRSERASEGDFLARSFGLCLVADGDVVGWCLSEYNAAARCEVGIAIDPQHQRKGLGTLLTRAFLVEARSRGLRRVGWDCWSSNLPSSATARRAGFTRVAEHCVLFAFCDEAEHLGAHGHRAFQDGAYEQALTYFRQSTARQQAPAWVWYEAGCAEAALGHPDDALRCLRAAVSAGLTDRDAYNRAPHLQTLRGLTAWNLLMQSLDAADVSQAPG